MSTDRENVVSPTTSGKNIKFTEPQFNSFMGSKKIVKPFFDKKDVVYDYKQRKKMI